MDSNQNSAKIANPRKQQSNNNDYAAVQVPFMDKR